MAIQLPLVRVATLRPKGERTVFHVANRTRNKSVTLRMTDEEFAFFQKQMERAKAKNQTDFFLAVLRKKPITVIEDLQPLLVELKKQGINLNQAVRHFNEGTPIEKELLISIKNCNEVYRKLLEVK